MDGHLESYIDEADPQPQRFRLRQRWRSESHSPRWLALPAPDPLERAAQAQGRHVAWRASFKHRLRDYEPANKAPGWGAP